MRINLNNSLPCLGLLLLQACAVPDPPQEPAFTEQMASPSASPEEANSRVERRLALMGTWLRLEVDAGERSASLAASEAALRALETTEARLSTWRTDSELARLNQTFVGTSFHMSPTLERELYAVREIWRATSGAFDPGVGAVLEVWGVRSGGRLPSESELREARADGGLMALRLRGAEATRLHAGLVIEEGGFGKGAGLDRAAEALEAAGVRAAFLDLGGQVLLLGKRSVSLGLADPEDRERPLLSLELESGSLATSGNSERGILVQGKRRSHLIDPRTGRPAKDFGSLSVWAPDATSADALSTALYVMGPSQALEWALAHDSIEIIVLMTGADGPKAIATSGWKGRLQALDSKLEIQILETRKAINSSDENE